MAQSLEVTEPSNVPCSEVTEPSDVPCFSEVAGPSGVPCSSERVVSLHALNNKEKTCIETIDPNICCMCFGSFEDDVHDGDGARWVSCNCSRWLHEDCVEEFVVNKRGVKLFCPFCTDGYVA